MATSKKKKMWFWVIMLAMVGFFIRPIRANYKNEAGVPEFGSRVKRTGLFSVVYTPDTSWTGTVGLFGSSIAWTNVNGAKGLWTAV